MSVWNMKMEFRSRNIQTGSQKKIVSGKTPDVFMVSEKDLSLLAARGVLEKLNGYMNKEDQVAFYPVAF